jgi:hypothetical protein
MISRKALKSNEIQEDGFRCLTLAVVYQIRRCLKKMKSSLLQLSKRAAHN